jgi:hypothetical protein
MRWEWHVARVGEKRSACRILMEKPEGKGPLRRPRRRRKDNIKMDHRGIGSGVMDWIDLAENRVRRRSVIYTAVNLLVPWSVGKFLSSWATGGFSRRTQLRGVDVNKKKLAEVALYWRFSVAFGFGFLKRACGPRLAGGSRDRRVQA